MQIFLKDCIACFSELYMQSFSVIDLYRIVQEACMNFKQSKHAFLPKKENESSYAIIFQPHMQSKFPIQSTSLIPPDNSLKGQEDRRDVRLLRTTLNGTCIFTFELINLTHDIHLSQKRNIFCCPNKFN